MREDTLRIRIRRAKRAKGAKKMNQNTIIDALKRSLEQGNGSLDDLDTLMDRVKADIAKAKQEETERKAKEEAAAKAKKEAETKAKAEGIAELATRLLNGETTAADVAQVMQAYMDANNIEGEVDAKGIEESFKASQELHGAMDELVDSLKELFNVFNVEKPVKSHKETADDVIARFLKSHGL